MSKFRGQAACLILLAALVLMVHAGAAEPQNRPLRKQDPQTQLLNNYRKFPDRYIRVSGESWKYDDGARIAFHSFTLKNIAGAAYSGIEIRARYLDADGKAVHSQVLKIPGVLAPYQSKKYKELKVRNVPPAADQALLAIINASIGP